MKKLTLATMITSALVSSAVAANQAAGTTEQSPTDSTFATLDTNEDGFISQGEANKDNVWSYFVKVDEDADGQLSPREFNTYASIYSKADIALADTVDSSDSSDSSDQSVMAESDEAMADAKSAIGSAESEVDDSQSTVDNAEDAMSETQSDMATADSDMADAGDEASEMASSRLSKAKQDAISANAQNSNAKVDTQLTEHDSHDDVNTGVTASSDAANNAMENAEANAQNALDNAKELSVKGQDSIEHSADAMNEELEADTSHEQAEKSAAKGEHELAASSDVTINADLEKNNPALKAPEQPAPIEQAFTDVDTDADGFISKDEAKDAEISEHFDNADVDSDDMISQQEYNTFVKGQQLTMRYSVRYPYESE